MKVPEIVAKNVEKFYSKKLGGDIRIVKPTPLYLRLDGGNKSLGYYGGRAAKPVAQVEIKRHTGSGYYWIVLDIVYLPEVIRRFPDVKKIEWYPGEWVFFTEKGKEIIDEDSNDELYDLMWDSIYFDGTVLDVVMEHMGKGYFLLTDLSGYD